MAEGGGIVSSNMILMNEVSDATPNKVIKVKKGIMHEAEIDGGLDDEEEIERREAMESLSR